MCFRSHGDCRAGQIFTRRVFTETTGELFVWLVLVERQGCSLKLLRLLRGLKRCLLLRDSVVYRLAHTRLHSLLSWLGPGCTGVCHYESQILRQNIACGRILRQLVTLLHRDPAENFIRHFSFFQRTDLASRLWAAWVLSLDTSWLLGSRYYCCLNMLDWVARHLWVVLHSASSFETLSPVEWWRFTVLKTRFCRACFRILIQGMLFLLVNALLFVLLYCIWYSV